MMKTKLSVLFMALLAMLTLASCGDDDKSEKGSSSSVNHAPEVSITNIKTGDVFLSGDVITVAVEAKDEDGNLEQLRFYVDDILTDNRTQGQAVFTVAAGALSAGTHTLRVAAVDTKGEVTNASVMIDYLVSYIKQNDQVTKLARGNCTIQYNYQIQPSFYSSRVVRLYDDKGTLSFFIVTNTLVQLTMIDSGVWSYTSTWDYLAGSYFLWSLFGKQAQSKMESFTVTPSGSNFVIDAKIDANTSLHYEGPISIAIG